MNNNNYYYYYYNPNCLLRLLLFWAIAQRVAVIP
jgi:hypothetical protein